MAKNYDIEVLYVEEMSGSDVWSEQIYKLKGYYKGKLVTEQLFPAQQGPRTCSPAVFIMRVRNQIRRQYVKVGA